MRSFRHELPFLALALQVLVAAATLAAPAAAQPPCREWLVKGCTNVSSRGTLGSAGGDTLSGKTDEDGVGQDPSGTGSSLEGFAVTIQDQQSASVEPFSFVLRADRSGQPDASAGGLLLQTALVSPPSGVGTQAWLLTVTFTTASTVLPLCGASYYGLNLPANGAWPNDGLSIHAGTYYQVGNSQGDNPAPNAPNVAWSIPGGTGGNPAQPAPMCQSVGLLVPAAVLIMGNVDPTLTGSPTNCIANQGNRSFGAGGRWPRIGGGRADGLDCLVRGPANGFFAVYFGLTMCPGLPLGGLATGALYLNPAAIVAVSTGALGATGDGTTTLLPPGAVPVGVLNQPLGFQAATIDLVGAGSVNLSNLARTRFLP
ncbi:MAG: hypothetical protein R3F56_12905 [Planctomycetota bacterium]